MKVLFIDRDGCLIEEPADQQIDSIEKFALLPGVIPALRRFTEAGYRFVMVTNQDGLGTASYAQKDFDLIQDLLLKILGSQGIRFEEILICPHKPADACLCRKPQTKMVRRWIASNEMDRSRSFVIGDRQTDLELAENMGLRGFKVGKDNSWEAIAHAILDQPRTAKVSRKTKETEIEAQVDLDGSGSTKIQTGLGFFDHMLDQIARHGGFDLRLEAKGDLHIDEHHLVEDAALTLGAALKEALGDKRGIQRYGFWLPMDEANARVTIDLSGRAAFQMKAKFPASQVGGLHTEMVPHFFRSLSDAMLMSLHIEAEGENTHHVVECIFKAVGRSLRQAFAKSDGQGIPSTKGTL